MLRTKLFALAFASLLTVLATGCVVSFEPETAVNPVGTEHTVTVTLRDSNEVTDEVICDIFEDVLEEIEGMEEFEELFEEIGIPPIPCDAQAVGTTQLADVDFVVISGPNAGTNSDDDGECDPSCSETDDDNRISWTYLSNGVPGTDTIQVCGSVLLEPDALLGDVSASQLTDEEILELLEILEQLTLDAINDEFGTDYESSEELDCQTVTKTWEEPRRPNIGAGLSGLFAGQPTALPTAVAPAPAAPSPTIRPPSTGDAGLR